MKNIFVVVTLLIGFNQTIAQTYSIEGDLMKWHKISIVYDGPTTSELATPNPFADYRLETTFTNGSTTYVVPGYFAADGDAAETSEEEGNQWVVHFAPDQIGTWTFTTSFVEGTDISINGDAGTPGILDGVAGSFVVSVSNKTGKDFRARGRLAYVGEHYLQFQEDEKWFYKAGADAPENTLAYEDFDDVPNRGNRKKNWNPHQVDYIAADASEYTWQGGKGTELLGVVNYLSDTVGCNAMSFLTFSLAGDDENVFPHRLKVDIPTYNTYGDAQQWNDGVYHDRFDVSRMAQWERIFEYADKKGVYLHFKLQETENDHKMDGGDVDRERKLYFRELIARFGHHLALNWNNGEENTQTAQQEIDMAEYIHSIDPYHHNIVLHTYPGETGRYHSLTGNQSEYTGASIQTSNGTFNELFSRVQEWVDNSNIAGKKWIIAVDEPGSANIGIHADPNDIDLVRQKVLWGTMMAGGAGVEYYYGYQTGDHTDLTCQDHRSRDTKYKEAGHAISFFDNHMQDFLPFVNTDNSTTTASDDYVLTNNSNAVIVYRPNGGTTMITLDPTRVWTADWYNPRTGIYNDDNVSITTELIAPDTEDWVAVITSECLPEGTTCDDGNSATSNDMIDSECNCIGTSCPTAGTVCDDGDPNTSEDQEDGNCNCAGITPINIPSKIEAEDYINQQGIQTTTCNDTGGGLSVGYIENMDYTEYKVNVTAPGLYDLRFRASSNTSGGNIDFEIGSTNGTSAITNTGGWQSWEDFTVQATLNSGIQDMKLTFTGVAGYLFDVNYIDFTLVDCIEGDSCDDGNSNTSNDVYDANCNCIGEAPNYSSPLLEAEGAVVGSEWTIINDVDACNDAYTLPPNSTAFGTPPTGVNDIVEFIFNVDVAGAYKVFARVSADNGDSDSFWVRANGGTWQKWNKINFDYYGQGFKWSQVANWTSGDYPPVVTFDLSAGTNTVEFGWREPNAKLDKIFVTLEDLSILNKVGSTSEGYENSLNYIVEEACPSDTIFFDSSLDLNTILHQSARLNIDKPLVFKGNGIDQTIISGQGLRQIFEINAPTTILDLNLIDGFSESNGGAFINQNTLTLKNVKMENNKEGADPKAFTNNGNIIIEGSVITKEE